MYVRFHVPFSYQRHPSAMFIYTLQNRKSMIVFLLINTLENLKCSELIPTHQQKINIFESYFHFRFLATCGSTPETEGTLGVNRSEGCTCAVNAVCNNITGQCSGSLCGNKETILACDKSKSK